MPALKAIHTRAVPPPPPVESKPMVMGTVPVGKIVVTSGAEAVLSAKAGHDLICRHTNADWGEVSDDDTAENDAALKGNRAGYQSAYTVNGHLIWVITDWGRAITTLMLASEY